MISTTTKYGQFVINGYSDILTVGISRKGDESPQELVKKAIMFAKEYKCDICRKVEYTYKDCVTFKVKCNGNTSCHIYEYGKWVLGSPSATKKDIEAYQDKFGTDGCVHIGFVKKFWFREDFHGETLSFPTLEETLEEAKYAYGNCVDIYTNVEMHSFSQFVCKAKASGTYLP